MLYAITDRRLYGSGEAQSRQRLLEQTALWAASGVAFLQLREKDLSARDQVELARAIMSILRTTQKSSGSPGSTRLLINGRPDVALAADADGVHLPAGPDTLTPDEVRSIFIAAGRSKPPIVSISCHSLQEVEIARQQAADCILFAPVFEKVILEEKTISTASQKYTKTKILPGTGLALLKRACQVAAPIPVFALGGVTAENAVQCLRAGAAGIAAIRLMRESASAWENFVEST